MSTYSTISETDILDWYNFGKTIQKEEISTCTSDRLYDTDTDDRSSIASFRRAHVPDASYPTFYQEKEDRETLLTQGCAASEVSTESHRLDKVEELSTACGSQLTAAPSYLQTNTAFAAYRHGDSASKTDGRNLPIHAHKEEILNMVDMNRVVIIEGATGSGKTTQVPQYILDDCVEKKKPCNIIVTQPRRIAAISVCHRVQSERRCSGNDGPVGYQVGLDRNASKDTRLLYVTTGVLLQKLVAAKNMNDYTHIVLDEVHERDQEMDFLLLVVRKLSRTVSKNTKIILMSATMDVNLFASYFTVPLGDHMVPSPIVYVDGKTYPIYDFYIDDLYSLGTLPDLDFDEPKLLLEAVSLAVKLIARLDDVEKSEQCGSKNEEFAAERGAILCFLPGIEEITLLHKHLIANDLHLSRKWQVMPLHSTITLEEQQRVFLQSKSGFRKVILATNIAESSITVSDVRFVIDFCLTKNLVFDSTTNYSSLQLEWASRANCTQRRGRAGRVANGRCYVMVSRDFYQQLEDFSVPEMKRCPLDKCVLQAKMLDLGEPKALLGLAIDPPNLIDIERTILTLFEVFALSLKVNENGKINPQDGDLTFVGNVLAKLPIDVHLGKLILLGHAFGCLEECIIIAAGLSQKSIFSKPFQFPLLAYRNKMSWAHQSMSDCIGIVHVYKRFIAHLNSRAFHRPGTRGLKEWGRMNFVQVHRLYDVKKLVEELTQRLKRINIHANPTFTHRARTIQDRINNENILKLVIAGAFYPNYFTQNNVDERMLLRDLGNFDLENTVVIGGLPAGYGFLYKSKIENLFRDQGLASTNPTLEFDHSKVYVRFRQSNMCFPEIDDEKEEQKRERIAPEVYCSVKARQLRIPLELQLIPQAEAERRLMEMENKARSSREVPSLRTTRVSSSAFSKIEQVPLPSLDMKTLKFTVTYVVNCAHFWAIYYDDDVHADIARMIHNLTQHSLPVPEVVYPDMLCLAPYKDQNINYYRARVESVCGNDVEVFFVDYGNYATVKKNELKLIEDVNRRLLTIPQQAFECYLSCIGPSPVNCPNGTWSTAARNYFCSMVMGKELIGRVYSVIHNVIRLEIVIKKSSGADHLLNDVLVETGYAIPVEESYLSKQNHVLRTRAHHDSIFEPKEDHSHMLPMSLDELDTLSRGGRKIKLRGPSTPAEKSFTGLNRACSYMAVRIEQDSVNSVLFHEKPQDQHQVLLVAADVSLHPSMTSITARSTTVMPDVPGLLQLVAIVFSPRVEFRTDAKRQFYSGALCGLGCDESTNEPIFTDHDMEIIFDAKITAEDIAKVNKIRVGLNILLGTEEKLCGDVGGNLSLIQRTLREEILSLIFQSREILETEYVFPKQYRWNVADRSLLLLPQAEAAGDDDVLQTLPLLPAVKLDVDLVAYVQRLHSRASAAADETFKAIYCEFCKKVLLSLPDLRKHLLDRNHVKLEHKYYPKNFKPYMLNGSDTSLQLT